MKVLTKSFQLQPMGKMVHSDFVIMLLLINFPLIHPLIDSFPYSFAHRYGFWEREMNEHF
jgi:hypothetical protein